MDNCRRYWAARGALNTKRINAKTGMFRVNLEFAIMEELVRGRK